MKYFGLILLIHFIGDFVFQSRMMGENKSHSMYWLSMHILAYTACLVVLSFPFFMTFMNYAIWVLINMGLHFCTDFITSRLSTFYYKKQNMYAFWKVIGIDQMIHGLCLYYTYLYCNF